MATHDRKCCKAHLVLVAPPISNTVAAFIDDQQAIEQLRCIDQLRRSHFYMICGRSKATFDTAEVTEEGSIAIDIHLDSGLSSSGRIHIDNMEFSDGMPDEFELQIMGDKNVIKIYLADELVFATTPDELLMRRGRKEDIVSGFDNYRKMLTFDLLYVGIAKQNQDSYSRLIEKGHKARMDILAAEPQRHRDSRVSDETYLLLFAIEPLILKTFNGDDELDDEDLDFSCNYHRIVADAEKAVISIFKPKYNKQLYVNYPRGIDGLYEQGYDKYIYSISEGFAFNTLYGTIKGARSTEELLLSNDADFISICGDEVGINISGKDFNISAEHPELET